MTMTVIHVTFVVEHVIAMALLDHTPNPAALLLSSFKATLDKSYRDTSSMDVQRRVEWWMMRHEGRLDSDG
ncbi:uncharacterized protein PHALS_14647 [Plasmopara halstedii]|uniref:Uncharacterized protein n=1 Tax=Plasmopara halstedii TaxID=4781 RepID=A0A0P1AMR0_PLAHL|nr:uncharacterized protein PHALS_14647 [Plasmopara halstedii]CEG42676.1 hypothetical protein PHALS_14647 [Plasmopara halstedii]|eukprot:XP_024579045.1 hypothetical protein PHALS_14647 [Plasmopara halstedii]